MSISWPSFMTKRFTKYIQKCILQPVLMVNIMPHISKLMEWFKMWKIWGIIRLLRLENIPKS